MTHATTPTSFPEPLPATPGAAARPASILVWDLPVRVFHWLLALSFAGAWLSAESERWRLLHVTLGYTMGGLLVFRVLWGLVGTRHARFSDFVRGPRAVLAYLRSLFQGRPEHHVGHNPAGALAILALMGLGAAIVGSGWAAYHEWGGEWLAEAHEIAATLMLVLVGVHVAAVLLSSRLHRENLVGSMFTGRKSGPPEQAITQAWRSVGVLMLVAVLGFWWLQWRSAPVAPARDSAAAGQHAGHGEGGKHGGQGGRADRPGGRLGDGD
jgi:cytochrome b